MATERDPVFGCELAQGRTDKDGYCFWGRTRAHIAAWERVNGPRPPGMELDHRCRVRRCCAVHHLRLATRSENEKAKRFSYRLKHFCSKGHDVVNRVVTNERGVVCRQCNREAIGASL